MKEVCELINQSKESSLDTEAFAAEYFHERLSSTKETDDGADAEAEGAGAEAEGADAAAGEDGKLGQTWVAHKHYDQFAHLKSELISALSENAGVTINALPERDAAPDDFNTFLTECVLENLERGCVSRFLLTSSQKRASTSL